MRLLIAGLLAWAGMAQAQTTEVFPGELTLDVTIENADVAPFEQEMVLLTIHGQYSRHITLEKLEQPDLAGFNWLQLGPDHWYETQVAGKKIKNLTRRMALFPDKPGQLTIGPFTHHLTLTDENDAWFKHDIQSEPISLKVLPAPLVDGWWFPARQLRVMDNWSNAPDQMKPGEGVLRIIRLEAIGVGPDMIPPMPELKSPSAMIFAHPEQRLVELSPEGPVSVAFWRWTIRPGNDTSAIVEPLSFDFYDTRNRVARKVVISAQRVAMDESTLPPVVPAPDPARLYPAAVLVVLGLALAVGFGAGLTGRRFDGANWLRTFPPFDPLHRAVRRAGAARDLPGLRRAMASMIRRDGAGRDRHALLRELDNAVFDPRATSPDTAALARRFLHQRLATT